ncbi:MAG: hypothetical protein M0Z55_09570 [Peptococcaceae bacterium]|nr:hypothetical protein [Peptococcaceae bacterium]
MTENPACELGSTPRVNFPRELSGEILVGGSDFLRYQEMTHAVSLSEPIG